MPGIESEHRVEIILDKDAFTVEYDAARTSLEDMYSAITALGYTPRLATAETGVSGFPTPLDENSNPVLIALVSAQREGKLVFVDFHAEWCIACKALEQLTLTTDAVQTALKNFIVVKVDTDLYPAAAAFYQVVGMPTLLVLDSDGIEEFRSVGPVSAEVLALRLNTLSRTSRGNAKEQAAIQQ